MVRQTPAGGPARHPHPGPARHTARLGTTGPGRAGGVCYWVRAKQVARWSFTRPQACIVA